MQTQQPLQGQEPSSPDQNIIGPVPPKLLEAHRARDVMTGLVGKGDPADQFSRQPLGGKPKVDRNMGYRAPYKGQRSGRRGRN